MIQSGHRWAVPNYEFITHDYNLTPVKPTIDMEARYETHAVLSGGVQRDGWMLIKFEKRLTGRCWPALPAMGTAIITFVNSMTRLADAFL